MISFDTGKTTFQTLSQNQSTANATLYGQLANIEHRYLLQKYFNNEGRYQIATVGSTSLSLTSAPAVNAVSATLAVAWAFPSCQTTVTFSDGEVRNVNFTNGSTAITWSGALTGSQFNLTTTVAAAATTATLQSAWSTATQTSTTVFSDGSTKSVTFTLGSTTITWVGGLSQAVLGYVNTSIMSITISVGGVQFYRMPPNYSKLKDVTITVGNLTWTLDEIRTREEWDRLNVFPYYANIPKNFFIYAGGDKGGMIGIWPIPSSTGNIITFNYKFRVPDLSLADYSTGTVSVTNGSTAVTGSGTVWVVTTNQQLESRWIQIAQPLGDNLFYQVQSVDSSTGITLYQPYQGITVSGGTYLLGQMPLLPEDFQDMLLWKSLVHYYGTIKKDTEKHSMHEETYKEKLKLLNDYSGSNTVQVNLSPHSQGRNPNLYPYTLQG